MDNYFPSLNKFLTSKLGAFFIILPFVKPAAEITGDFDVIFDVWKLVASALILIGCVWTLNKANRIVYWIMGLQLLFLLATIINQADFKAAIVQVLSIISISIYFDYFMRMDAKKAVSTLMLPLVFMSLLTALTMFVFYPNGMYTVGDESSGPVEHQNFLWGFDNSSIFNFIPGMYLMGLFSLFTENKKTKKKVLLALLFIALAFLYVFSITAFLGCFTILFALVFLNIYKRKIKVFTTFNLTVLVIVISFILIVANENLQILMNFSKLTDKFNSIRTRFVIWYYVIDWWKKSPVFGYGIEDKMLLIKKIKLDHPHNYFMDVLYRGGLIGIGVITGIFIKLIKGKWSDSHINAFSAVVLFVLLLTAQFDFYNDHYLFYPIMIVVMYCKNLVIDNNKNADQVVDINGFI